MASATDYRRLAKHQRGLYFTATERDAELAEEFLEVRGREVLVGFKKDKEILNAEETP